MRCVLCPLWIIRKNTALVIQVKYVEIPVLKFQVPTAHHCEMYNADSAQSVCITSRYTRLKLTQVDDTETKSSSALYQTEQTIPD